MFGLWRYGFRDGGGLPALRSADGKAVPEMREYKYRSYFGFGIFAANTIKNDYQCKNCGHKFC